MMLPTCAPKRSMSASPGPFPPALHLLEAKTWRIATEQMLMQAAQHTYAGETLAAVWPELVCASEAALRIPDAATFDATVKALRIRIERLYTGDCLMWEAHLKLQDAYLQEIKALHASVHAADVPAVWRPPSIVQRSVANLRETYEALHDAACVAGGLKVQAAGQMWCEESGDVAVVARQQRYLFNLSTNDRLVHLDGTVGGACSPDQFVALVAVQVHASLGDKVAMTQGQGPVTEHAKQRYLTAAVRYACQQNLTHILFVNAAEGDGQIPSFAETIAAYEPTPGLKLAYQGTIAWGDGQLVTPAGAASFAAEVAHAVRTAQGRTLLVINCNAGLDRSGITTILVQLMLSCAQGHLCRATPDERIRWGFDQIPILVKELKRARPHAISSFGRYIFIHQAFAAYVDSQK
jgi:hypothetical protein